MTNRQSSVLGSLPVSGEVQDACTYVNIPNARIHLNLLQQQMGTSSSLPNTHMHMGMGTTFVTPNAEKPDSLLRL